MGEPFKLGSPCAIVVDYIIIALGSGAAAGLPHAHLSKAIHLWCADQHHPSPEN